VEGTRVVEVTLQGRAFTLRTDEDEQTVREAEAFANERLDEVGAGGALSPHAAALLTVLTLAEELRRERRAAATVRDRAGVRARRALDALEAGTDAGTALRSEG
jgi:hypothetical protein